MSTDNKLSEYERYTSGQLSVVILLELDALMKITGDIGTSGPDGKGLKISVAIRRTEVLQEILAVLLRRAGGAL